MNSMHIKYYAEDYYVYENGVYKENRVAIEKQILKININSKIRQINEVLNFIKLETYISDLDICTQFINFRNRYVRFD